MARQDTPERPTETAPKKKRRSACGCFLLLVLIVLAIAVAVVGFFFLRQNPEAPLQQWIPPQAEMAASVRLDFSKDGLGGLIEIMMASDRSLTPQERQQITTAIDQLLKLALFPKILLVGRIEPETLEAKWAVVGNLRRGQTLIEPLANQFLGDAVKWSAEGSGEKKIRRMQIPDYGVEGVLDGTQVVLAGDRAWLDEVVHQSSITREPLPLDRIQNRDAQISAAIEDPDGTLRKVLDDFAQDQGDPEIALGAQQLQRLLQDSNGSATIDAWILVKSAKVIITPGGNADFQPQTVNTVASDLQKELSNILDLPHAKIAQAVTHAGKQGVQVEIPAFGYLLGEALK